MSYFQGSNRHWINYREFRGITGTPYAAVQCDRVPSSLQADGAGAASTTTVHVSGCTQRALLKLSAQQRGSCLDGLCSLASSRGGEDTKTYNSPTPAFGRSLNTGTTCPFRCRVSQKNANGPKMAPGDVKDVLDSVTANCRLFPVSPGEEADGGIVKSTWPV